MPYIRISTTNQLNEQQELELREAALDAAVENLHKPRHVVLVAIEHGMGLHRGDENNSCAFIDVRVLGESAKEACDAFALKLST